MDRGNEGPIYNCRRTRVEKSSYLHQGRYLYKKDVTENN
jgi:hypothetical protein